jgi:hypothetical protein
MSFDCIEVASELFVILEIALSEKQVPQVAVNKEKWSERMEASERAGELRRQMLYAAELRPPN